VKAEVVNKILASTTSVLTEYFNITLEQNGAPVTVNDTEALDAVTVILGITGDLEGQFLLGYNNTTALNIARVMLGNPDYPELDEMGKSALSELGNMIGGLTSTGLSDLGFFCNLSPPTLVTTSAGTICTGTPVMIALPISSSAGDFRVCVGLREN